MQTRRHDPLTRWLDAERNDHEDDAEAALMELFELLPPVAPRPGFSDRVLQRIGSAPAPAVMAHAVPATPEPPAMPAIPAIPAPGRFGRLVRSRSLQVAVALSLVATGASLFWLPQILAVVARILTVSDVLGLTAATAVDLGRWLSVVARVGEWLFTVGGALAVSLTSPAALTVTTACLAISGVSFVFLRDLMTRDRSWSYVDRMHMQ